MVNEHFRNMIKNFKHSIIRIDKTLKGKISNTDFLILNNCPSRYFDEKTKSIKPRMGRGFSRYKGENNRFFLFSNDYPKIEITKMPLIKPTEYSVALNLWGKDKSKDDILINQEFPTEKLAQEFLDFINKIGTYVS